jgi:hypothetical protein
MSEAENTRRPQPPGEKRGHGTETAIAIGAGLSKDAIAAAGKAAYNKVRKPKNPHEKK